MAGAHPAGQIHPGWTKRRSDHSRVAGGAVIVLDASVVVELLTNGPLADSIRRDLAERGESLIVPHLLDVEVVSAMRSLAAGRRIDAHRSQQFLADLATLPAERYPHAPLLDRIWELRHNFTAYDAVYIALAEATNSVLYTSDEKLCRGHRAQVILFAV
jgi:predicted nucleic acid-binding protein